MGFPKEEENFELFIFFFLLLPAGRERHDGDYMIPLFFCPFVVAGQGGDGLDDDQLFEMWPSVVSKRVKRMRVTAVA